MTIKSNWADTRQRFAAWWAGQSTGRPMLRLWAKRDTPFKNPYPFEPYTTPEELYFNTDKIIAQQFEMLCEYEPVAEAYPGLSLNLGAGSLALYMGSRPRCEWDTMWFEHIDLTYNDRGTVVFDPENHWYKTHLSMYRQAKDMIKGTDILLCIPDLVESLDILAALRGTTELCYDLYDYPDEVKAACAALNRHYETCFDAFNAICADENGESAFTIFNIWGKGRTAKVQCDVAAVLSPELFREFALPPLREQCRWLDNSLFHLDGPECICHVPILAEIEELNAIQWTPGHNNPPGGEECWYDLYRQIKEAGKGLWVGLYEYSPEVAVEKADKLVRKLGGDGFYFQMPQMEKKDAEALLIKAEREWKA